MGGGPTPKHIELPYEICNNSREKNEHQNRSIAKGQEGAVITSADERHALKDSFTRSRAKLFIGPAAASFQTARFPA